MWRGVRFVWGGVSGKSGGPHGHATWIPLERHLSSSYDNRTVHELHGHSNVITTMIYTHLLNSGRCPVRSPLT
jgi:hypothetical protein